LKRGFPKNLAIILVPELPPKRGVKHTLSIWDSHTLSILGCDQQNLENLLSDFKWSGHRLAHVFADGSSTASHQRKRTLLEAPTGTLLFYYNDIKQQIVHRLLLENYGVSKKWVIIMDRKQDSNAIRKKWTFGSEFLMCQRRREETAWKQRI